MKRNESNTTSGLLRRVGSLGKRLFATLLVTGALSIGLHSAANAQWVQGATNTDLAFQFPLGHVAIGVPFPAPYAGIKQFYVIGSSQFDGSMIVNNGPVDFFSPFNLRPTGGIANKMWFYSNNGTNFSSFTNGASTVNMSYTWPSAAPLAGQVLSSNVGGGLSWVTAGTGTVTGSGNPQFLPIWSGSTTNLANSVIQQFGAGPAASLLANTPNPPYPFIFPPAPTDLLQVSGNTRMGNVAIVAAPPPGPITGADLFFSGVNGTYGAPYDGDNSDAILMFRQNNAADNSQLNVSVGDNAEGIVSAVGGANTPDRFTLGATPTTGALTGIYQAGFSFSTANGLALGYGVANLNGLDVGLTAPLPGFTIPPKANVAIGTYGGVNLAPPNGLIVSGPTGVGTATPGNNLEVNNGFPAPNNLSGLRLSQFAGMTPFAAAPPNGFALSINPAGDVIATLAGGGGGTVTGTGVARQLAVWTSPSNITNGILYDDGVSKIGLNTTTPTSNLAFQFDASTTPAAQTIGVQRTTTATAPGTPLSITSGAGVSGGTDINGGDLTLRSGTVTGAGSSNIQFQVVGGNISGSTDHVAVTKMFLAGASGNLGLGTSSPAKDLSFEGNSNRTVWVERNGSSSGTHLTVQAGGGLSGAGGRAGGNLFLAAGISTGGASTAGTVQLQTPNVGSGSADNNPTTKVWITPTGTVGINRSAPAYTLDVDDLAGGTGTINASFKVYAGGVALTSDARFKTDIATISGALQKVMNIRGVQYNFRTDVPSAPKITGRQIGFIAQELQNVVPEAIDQRPDGYYAVEYHMVTPILVEAIKDQQREIVSADSELTIAHSTISDLTARVAKLESEIGQLLGQNNGSLEGNAPTNGVTFFQNDPNPFSRTTTIYYYIPETVQNAELVVSESTSGATTLRIPLSKGSNQVQVSAAKLQSSQYMYTIIADGAQLPSKKMTVLH
jgi:hypothetical protein